MQQLFSISFSVFFSLLLIHPIRSDYVIPPFQANWPSAIDHCFSIGKQLAITNTKARHDAVVRKIGQSTVVNWGSTTNIWIGASDLGKKGDFRWHGSGQKVSYQKWGPGNPDVTENVEQCVALLDAPKANWHWLPNVQNCNDKRFFVCQDRGVR